MAISLKRVKAVKEESKTLLRNLPEAPIDLTLDPLNAKSSTRLSALSVVTEADEESIQSVITNNKVVVFTIPYGPRPFHIKSNMK